MPAETKRLHATIEGRVQGVGFRYFVVNMAEELNLTGWVRNLANGDVEITVEGNTKDLERLLSHVRTGPPSSYVNNVSLDWSAAENTFTSFSIRSTY